MKALKQRYSVDFLYRAITDFKSGILFAALVLSIAHETYFAYAKKIHFLKIYRHLLNHTLRKLEMYLHEITGLGLNLMALIAFQSLAAEAANAETKFYRAIYNGGCR